MRRWALTFDNGPHPDATPRVLDVLAAHAVRAHFFVIGRRVLDPLGRRLVARAVAEGHCVGGHSFTHRVPLGEDPRPDAIEAEIRATDDLLTPIVGSARRFRPFAKGGALGPHLFSRRAVHFLVAERYTCVLWSSVPRDWVDPEGWVERALAAIARQESGVLVLHDVPNACGARLGSFLDRLADLGVELTQALPQACTPIVGGVVTGDLRGLVADPDPASAGTGAAAK